MTHAHERLRSSPWREILAVLNESRINPVKVNPRFFYQGKSYKIRSAGRRFLLLINRWKKVSEDENQSALGLREDIKRAIESPPPKLIACCLEQTSDALLVRLMLMIVRRGHVKSAKWEVFLKHDHRDPRVQRDVVRTLCQISAWHELRIVGRKCLSQDAQVLATTLAQRPSFEKRLKNFSRMARSYPHPEHETPLIIHPEADVTHGRRPRSGSQIGRVLRTIRHLIRRARRRRRRIRCIARSAYRSPTAT